jgi:hypothetical protein
MEAGIQSYTTAQCIGVSTPGTGGYHPDGSVGVRFRYAASQTYACGLTLEVVQSMGAGHPGILYDTKLVGINHIAQSSPGFYLISTAECPCGRFNNYRILTTKILNILFQVITFLFKFYNFVEKYINMYPITYL